MPATYLGIDPGLSATGWGLIESTDNKPRYQGSGIWTSEPTDKNGDNLSSFRRASVLVPQIRDTLSEIIRHHPETKIGIETPAYKTKHSSHNVSLASGIIYAIMTDIGIIDVGEIAPAGWKNKLFKNTQITKSQTRQKIAELLDNPSLAKLKNDETDALSIAYWRWLVD